MNRSQPHCKEVSRTLVKVAIKDGTKIKSERRGEGNYRCGCACPCSQSPNTESSFKRQALVLQLLVIRPSGQQVSGTSPSKDETGEPGGWEHRAGL